jgi:predicted alpha/beta-hydrolase family hydrolase
VPRAGARHCLVIADRSAPSWTVALDGGTVTATLDAAAVAPARALFVCGHGAGGHRDDAAMRAATAALCAISLDTVRFNFPYRERGSKRPDPMPALEACFAAVAARARDELRPRRLILGGRSMGGRVASMLVAQGFACDGLLLLAYPLHPDGQPEKLRDAHLARIGVPVLCLNGTRDALCRRDLMQPIAERLGARWTMHWLDGADHSFHVLKSSGRTDHDVLAEAAGAADRWLSALEKTSPSPASGGVLGSGPFGGPIADQGPR